MKSVFMKSLRSWVVKDVSLLSSVNVSDADLPTWSSMSTSTGERITQTCAG